MEEFKYFLVKHDLPIFSLTEVVSYMDKKAAAEKGITSPVAGDADILLAPLEAE